MLFRQLALAATAAGFLVVPETTEAEDEVYKALPIDVQTNDVPASAMGQTVQVPCSKCEGPDSQLNLGFSVEEGTRLTLNGYELYPTPDPWSSDLKASIVKANGQEQEQRLGYSLAVGPEAIDADQGLEIINVGLHVLEVGEHIVDGIPMVNVKLIKVLQTGDILIGGVDTREFSHPECHNIWCRIQQGWEDAWEGLSSCSMGMSQGSSGDQDSEELGDGTDYGEFSTLDDYDIDWSEFAEALIFGVLLPVLIGIAAGMLVAVFAMGVGSFIAIILRSRRRCRRASHRAKATLTEPAAEEEKTGLMDERDFEEPPPKYDGEQHDVASPIDVAR